MPAQPIRIPIERELDLHSFLPRDIASVVADYIDLAAAAGFEEVRLEDLAHRIVDLAKARRLG